MKLTSYFNPLNLIRWAFVGKRLTEIVDFDEKRAELDAFFTRTEQRKERKQKRIEILEAQNAVHVGDMGKARLMSDNLLVLMTQALGKPVEQSGEAA